MQQNASCTQTGHRSVSGLTYRDKQRLTPTEAFRENMQTAHSRAVDSEGDMKINFNSY